MLDEIILADKEKTFVKFNQHGGDDARYTPPIFTVVVAAVELLSEPRYYFY